MKFLVMGRKFEKFYDKIKIHTIEHIFFYYKIPKKLRDCSDKVLKR